MLKVNQVLLNWEKGAVHNLDWLSKYKVNSKLAYKYVQTGYLKGIGSGVFAKSTDKIDPFSVVKCLQQEVGLNLHISGKASLELHGHEHYLQLSDNNELTLISYSSRAFPEWPENCSEEFQISFKKSSLFKNVNFLSSYVSKNGFEVKISSREMAILELIDSLNLKSSLEVVENYLESLQTLRSSIVQELLEECNSVKVKRVFLYLAEKLELDFFKKLDLDKIDLGSGKRVVVEKGQLDKKYQITVDRQSEENPF